jgi:hypothetical protein
MPTLSLARSFPGSHSPRNTTPPISKVSPQTRIEPQQESATPAPMARTSKAKAKGNEIPFSHTRVSNRSKPNRHCPEQRERERDTPKREYAQVEHEKGKEHSSEIQKPRITLFLTLPYLTFSSHLFRTHIILHMLLPPSLPSHPSFPPQQASIDTYKIILTKAMKRETSFSLSFILNIIINLQCGVKKNVTQVSLARGCISAELAVA